MHKRLGMDGVQVSVVWPFALSVHFHFGWKVCSMLSLIEMKRLWKPLVGAKQVKLYTAVNYSHTTKIMCGNRLPSLGYGKESRAPMAPESYLPHGNPICQYDFHACYKCVFHAPEIIENECKRLEAKCFGIYVAMLFFGQISAFIDRNDFTRFINNIIWLEILKAAINTNFGFEICMDAPRATDTRNADDKKKSHQTEEWGI